MVGENAWAERTFIPVFEIRVNTPIGVIENYASMAIEMPRLNTIVSAREC